MRGPAILLLIFALGAFEANAQNLTIELITPKDGVKVSQQQYVKGKVSDPSATVIVVVHPTGTSGFWVQSPVTVKNSGVWKVKAFFGRAGKDRGVEFEVRAFAGPTSSMAEGKQGNWPDAQAQSDVIDVVRQ